MPVLDNQRWEIFAQGLASGKTADAAYVEAGYKENRHNASRLSTNETVQARKNELLAAAAEKTGITVEWITERLRLNVDRSMQHEPVTNSKGESIGEYRYDGSVANKALELLGKHKGMFKENMSLTNEVSLSELVIASYEKGKAAKDG